MLLSSLWGLKKQLVKTFLYAVIDNREESKYNVLYKAG